MGSMWDAAKSLGSALWRGKGAKARAPACPSGYVLTTDGELCIDDFVLDTETGELITPAEAERRAHAGLVWDDRAEEWVTRDEALERRRARGVAAAQRRQEGRREQPTEVYDHQAGEWVGAPELARRQQRREALRTVLAAGPLLNLDRLPSLAVPAALKLNVGSDGVALLRGESAAEALATDGGFTADEAAAAEDAGWKDYLKGLTGPDRRDEEEARRTRLLIIASLGAIIATLVLTRSRG